MENDFFQKVFDIIQPWLPVQWNKMVFYAGYTTGSYSMKFYVRERNSKYTDCFNLKTIENVQLLKVFMSIDKIIVPEREKLAEKDKWSVLTLTVDTTGNMKAEFDYTDISENVIEYERAWKDKYLI